MTRQRALVVDDDESIRTMVVRLLEREGLIVETARDGAEAIIRLQHGDFDVVLLDLMMPRVDGFGVIDHLQHHRPELVPHIVVMTAYSREAESKLDGTCRVIPKPFDIFRLVEQVRACMGPASAAAE